MSCLYHSQSPSSWTLLTNLSKRPSCVYTSQQQDFSTVWKVEDREAGTHGSPCNCYLITPGVFRWNIRLLGLRSNIISIEYKSKHHIWLVLDGRVGYKHLIILFLLSFDWWGRWHYIVIQNHIQWFLTIQMETEMKRTSDDSTWLSTESSK